MELYPIGPTGPVTDAAEKILTVSDGSAPRPPGRGIVA
jgi:hypothetical protein